MAKSKESSGEASMKPVDPLVIKVTANELKSTEEGKILVKLYKEGAFEGGLKLEDLKDCASDSKTLVTKLRKLSRIGCIKEIKPLIGNQKYYCLTELGKKIAEEIVNLTKTEQSVKE
jgi:DNA-binding HxlR family transcriptional regulator